MDKTQCEYIHEPTKLDEFLEKHGNPKGVFQLIDLLFDLGTWLANQPDYSEYRNDEVFEDPLNRGDELGNVRMIHRKVPKVETEISHQLAEGLTQLAHEAFLRLRKQEATADLIDGLFYHLEEADDLESETIMGAKRRIAETRRELRIAHRKMDNQSHIIERLTETLERTRTAFRNYASSISPDNLRNNQQAEFHDQSKRLESKINTRNVDKIQREDSLDFLSFE